MPQTRKNIVSFESFLRDELEKMLILNIIRVYLSKNVENFQNEIYSTPHVSFPVHDP